ncbi:EscT/YscT/HrcT family type III secretion system export apparatus protein [Pendulispora albinea]|uniref:Flagellar biosynthetic protein FliR n=1 Tax=Pendulispora albinea TaxID=2741071 RepID=A0ABZ2M4B4_9BACT
MSASGFLFGHAAFAPPTSVAGLLGAVIQAFTGAGVDLPALGLAWARVLPTVLIVPAFGLRALPTPLRAILGAMLALCIFPAVVADAGAHAREPWPLLLLENFLHGLPVALAAAIPLWAATMAGNLVDTLRGARDAWNADTVEGKASHLGIAFALLASTLFLQSGGPSRIALALATTDFPAHPLLAAVRDLSAGITLAVALGGPLLAASIVLEVAVALVARASFPAQIYAVFPPLRALGLLVVMALVFERIAFVLARAIR